MKLENEFTVPAPVDRAWEVLLDLERVAPCLPGAAIDGREGDAHTGTMTVKIGPITARYKGTVKIEESDEQAHRAVMRAQARDARGQGTAAATITSSMEAVDDGTRVRVETDMRITGPAAQFGRGVMQDVSAKMMGRFAECLAGLMGEDGAPAADAVPAAEATAAPAAEATAAPAAEEPAPAAAAPPPPQPPPPRPTEEVLDLGEVSRDAVLKRVAPVAAGALGLLLLLVLRRRR
jgi:carbon monoxide dehydrogenase subunit G